ncbi:MAG: hypothetical protein QHJ82_11395, partial [Verrucomicrobiota bacterium]|nr:hypothetical protein [Verrucomicrobiota bacterium]
GGKSRGRWALGDFGSGYAGPGNMRVRSAGKNKNWQRRFNLLKSQAFKVCEFCFSRALFESMVWEMNDGLEARKAQRLLWAVVVGFILLNAFIVYFAFRPGVKSAEGNRELPAATNVLESAGTNRP